MTATAVRSARPGVSRGGLVVVLTLLLLLTGLVVAGVVRLRQSAQMMQCSNNLRQLTLGVQGYRDATGRLPPLVDQGDGAPTGRGLSSVFATLIPYLESTPFRLPTKDTPAEGYHAASSVEFTYQYKGGGSYHGGMANHVMRVFLCSADVTADQLRDVPVTLPDGSTGHYAAGSYAANGLPPWGGKDVPLHVGTLIFAERPQVCRSPAGETHNLWGVGFYGPTMPAFAALAPPDFGSTGQVAPVLPLPDPDSPLAMRIGTADAKPRPLDFATPFQRIDPSRRCDPRLPGSSHPDGMLAAMGDGSVRTFRHDTTPWVFWSACVAEGKKP